MKLVEYLIKKGANLADDKNKESWTPQYNGIYRIKFYRDDCKLVILVACYNKHYDVMKYLCSDKVGANINAKTNSGVTLLHRACIDGAFDSVKYLCENKADVNARSTDGNTPLISCN